MKWPQFLTFASDAGIMATWGAVFILLALISLIGERMRQKRARIDRVGWVPWTGLFLASVVIGGGLLALAVPGLLRGGA